MNRFFDKPGGDNPPRMIIAHEQGDRWYMVSNPKPWELEKRPHGYNAGDCLWWTGLAALTYPDRDKEFLNGILEISPVNIVGTDNVWKRHPFGELEATVDPIDDFTRDQLILAISALALLDYPSAKEAIDKTNKFRLSKKTFGRLELWFWLQAIKHKDDFWGKVWTRLFTTGFVLRKSFSLIWTRITENMLGHKVKQIHPNDLKEEIKFNTGASRFVNKWLRPKAFPLHLAAWKLYTLRELGLGKAPFCGAILRSLAGRYNYLIYLLTGVKINKDIIEAYESRHGWIWQTYLDHTHYIQPKCTEEEAKYNAMDKDLLWLLWKKL